MSGESLEVTWLGHASIMLRVAESYVLVDPLLRRRVGPLINRAPLDLVPSEVDAILITHLHADHCDLPSLRRFASDTRIIVPRGTEQWFVARGFTNIEPLSDWHVTRVGALTVEAVPAHHPTPVWGKAKALSRHSHTIGYVVAVAGVANTTTYIAGDTDVFPAMSDIGARELALACIPIGGWGPRVPAGHLNAARAAEAVRMLRPRKVIPVHWGTLRPLVGGALIDLIHRGEAERFERRIEARAAGVDVVVLPSGASFTLGDS